MIDYLSMVNFINERKTLCNLIKYANKIITAVIFVSYPVFLAFLFYYKNDNLLKYVLFPAVPFVLVSVFRHFFNAQRPYEKYGYVYPKNSTSAIFDPNFLNDIEGMELLEKVYGVGCCTD
ncbi:MAG: hypothetical protein U0L17_08230, partial [Acutalibacteraceae bacterium]|nr:hypothetical protein [Acutalibacteraceae bacterium]